MDQDKDKKLDEFFRDAMHNHPEHSDFIEHDWDRMEQMLERQNKPFVMWIRVAGIAAMLLLMAGIWWWLLPRSNKNDDSATQVARIKPKQDIKEQRTQPVFTEKGDSTAGLTVRKGVTAAGAVFGENGSGPAVAPFKADEPVVSKLAQTGKTKPDMGEVQAPDKIAGLPDTASGQVEVIASRNTDTSSNVDKSPVKQVTPQIKMRSNRPVFAISVLGSSDINGVSSFGNGKVGANVGVMFSMKLGRKWTISTGAAYAYKPYATSFSNYTTMYKFATDPERVMADCRVLDIPLNVDYNFYNKNRNALSFGAGLSSWFMLNEKYTFSYPANYSGPASYSVSNQNRHILGVLNLQATYHRQINQKLGIALQPFLKLPLTNIGYSQVRLQSAGVAAGITWNISP